MSDSFTDEDRQMTKLATLGVAVWLGDRWLVFVAVNLPDLNFKMRGVYLQGSVVEMLLSKQWDTCSQ